MINLNSIPTEQRNPNSLMLDTLSTLEIVKTINEEDKKVPLAIEKILPQIAEVAEHIAEAFRQGGRLVYVGAGTSGRLGVLDASECPPTFGADPKMVVGLIAGGDRALRHPIEGAEDDKEQGKKDLKEINFSAKDVLVGIGASGRTPYVIGALEYANELGAFTAGISSSSESPISQASKVALPTETGAEVLTGSTRMKSGTAQKLVLNMLTTTGMILIGKVYGNLMVDVQASNAKLVERQIKIVMDATECDRETAQKALEACERSCKIAIVHILTGTSPEESRLKIENANGFLRGALSTK
ncbi:MAG: N-acetylmuramic acid 6-phosphate etherase [Brevinema sp.]